MEPGTERTNENSASDPNEIRAIQCDITVEEFTATWLTSVSIRVRMGTMSPAYSCLQDFVSHGALGAVC